MLPVKIVSVGMISCLVEKFAHIAFVRRGNYEREGSEEGREEPDIAKGSGKV